PAAPSTAPAAICRASRCLPPCACAPMCRQCTGSRPHSAADRQSTIWWRPAVNFTNSATLPGNDSTPCRGSAASSPWVRSTCFPIWIQTCTRSPTTSSSCSTCCCNRSCCWCRALPSTGSTPSISAWYFCPRWMNSIRPWIGSNIFWSGCAPAEAGAQSVTAKHQSPRSIGHREADSTQIGGQHGITGDHLEVAKLAPLRTAAAQGVESPPDVCCRRQRRRHAVVLLPHIEGCQHGPSQGIGPRCHGQHPSNLGRGYRRRDPPPGTEPGMHRAGAIFAPLPAVTGDVGGAHGDLGPQAHVEPWFTLPDV